MTYNSRLKKRRRLESEEEKSELEFDMGDPPA